MTTYHRTVRNGIVRQEHTVETPAGVIRFTRPDDMYLGLKRWHVDFHVTQSDGREYWGTVWTNGRARIYGHRAGRGYQLPYSQLKPLRTTLADIAPALIREERTSRDMTSEPQQIGMIDCTPTWSAIMPALIAALENGTETGKQMAREELTRLAALVDRSNAQ